LKRVLIIGSGPAGLTAAIYAARAGLDALVFAGATPGGQLMLTTDIENYPGFSSGIKGPELMDEMRRQAERLEAKFVDGDATSVDFSKKPFEASVGGEVYRGDAVIIATGASARWLGLESEQKLRGRGISSCATCDGFFFKDKDTVVVGGGDAAIEEALFLSKIARSVTVIHRRDRLRASKLMQDRAFKNDKIRFVWNSVVVEILGREKVEGVLVQDVRSGEKKEIKCDGAFIAVGHKPNTELFRGKVELDDRGYIVTRNETLSSVEGVLAAGDVCDPIYRQAVTAAASGCKAAIDAAKYLES